MDSNISFNTFEIASITLHLLIFVFVILSYINTHTGDCRGALVSTSQNPDGYSITRQAKLSIHESPHEI